MEKIEAAGAGFRSLTEAIDTTTPAGRMMMQMVGSFAEFERALIGERQREGIALAKKRGAYRGRKKALSSNRIAELRQRVANGEQKARRSRRQGRKQGGTRKEGRPAKRRHGSRSVNVRR